MDIRSKGKEPFHRDQLEVEVGIRGRWGTVVENAYPSVNYCIRM